MTFDTAAADVTVCFLINRTDWVKNQSSVSDSADCTRPQEKQHILSKAWIKETHFTIAPVKECGSPNKDLRPGSVYKRIHTVDNNDRKHVNQIWYPLGIIFKTCNPLLQVFSNLKGRKVCHKFHTNILFYINLDLFRLHVERFSRNFQKKKV